MLILIIFIIPTIIGCVIYKLITISLMQYGIKDIRIDKNGFSWIYYEDLEE